MIPAFKKILLLQAMMIFLGNQNPAKADIKDLSGEWLDQWQNAAVSGVDNFVYSDEMTELMLSLQWSVDSRQPLAYFYNSSGYCKLGTACWRKDTLNVDYKFRINYLNDNLTVEPVNGEYDRYLFSDNGLVGIEGAKNDKERSADGSRAKTLVYAPRDLAGTKMFRYNYPDTLVKENRLRLGMNRCIPCRLSVITREFIDELSGMILRGNYHGDETFRRVASRIASLFDLGINDGVEMDLDNDTRLVISDSLNAHKSTINVSDIQLLYLSGNYCDFIQRNLPFLSSVNFYKQLYGIMITPAEKWCEEMARNILTGQRSDSELSEMFACAEGDFTDKLIRYYQDHIAVTPVELKTIELISRYVLAYVAPSDVATSAAGIIVSDFMSEIQDRMTPECLRTIIFYSYMVDNLNNLTGKLLIDREISFNEWRNINQRIISPMTEIINSAFEIKKNIGKINCLCMRIFSLFRVSAFLMVIYVSSVSIKSDGAESQVSGYRTSSFKTTEILANDTLLFQELAESDKIKIEKSPSFSIASGSVSLNKNHDCRINYFFDNENDLIEYWNRFYCASIIGSYPDSVSLPIIRKCLKKRSGVLTSVIHIMSDGEIRVVSTNFKIAIRLIYNMLKSIDSFGEIYIDRKSGNCLSEQSESMEPHISYTIPMRLIKLGEWLENQGIDVDSMTIYDVKRWIDRSNGSLTVGF